MILLFRFPNKAIDQMYMIVSEAEQHGSQITVKWATLLEEPMCAK